MKMKVISALYDASLRASKYPWHQMALHLASLKKIKKNLFKKLLNIYMFIQTGGTLLVVQLVEALHYKQEGLGFDSRCYHWNFLFTL
jgi:hypothetical protein